MTTLPMTILTIYWAKAQTGYISERSLQNLPKHTTVLSSHYVALLERADTHTKKEKGKQTGFVLFVNKTNQKEN